MNTYNDTHWEELIDTIINRIGVLKFVEIVTKRLKRYGYTIDSNIKSLRLTTQDEGK
jgi:hypothetical protein